MNSFKAGIDAFFLHRRHFSFGNFGVTAFINKGRQFRIIFRCLLCQRVTCRYRQVGTTHKGVRAGSVNGQCVVIVVNVEGDFHAFGTTDPVTLHGFNSVWPVIQFIQIVKQLVSVSGDFDKPLRDLFTFNFGITTPAAAVDNLLVRQYGLVVRAPVDRRSLLIYQAFFIQLGEEFLFPTVVFWRTGRQLAAPVITKAQHFELVFHVRDVVIRPRCWRGVVFHRCAFRRQTKRIPADRLKNVFAQHTLVAGDHVTNGVVTNVAHV